MLSIPAYAAFLVAFGNAKAILLGPSPAGSLTGVGAGLLLSGVVVAWSRAARLGPAELGVAVHPPSAAGRSLRAGLLWGLGLGAVPLAAAYLDLLPSDRPEAEVPWPDLARRIALYLPLDTVLPEELAFRGLLLGWLLRARGLDPRNPLGALASPARPAAGSSPMKGIQRLPGRLWSLLRGPATVPVLLAAVPFVLWHLALAWREMPEPRLGELAAKLVGYFLGGVVFRYLRVATGHLAGSLAAHWAFNALAMLAARVAAR
jgi:membrane protease YdiL (CAAX protease family)